jgi:hypothetical protein
VCVLNKEVPAIIALFSLSLSWAGIVSGNYFSCAADTRGAASLVIMRPAGRDAKPNQKENNTQAAD